MPIIDMVATGANIKKMRIAAGMTIADITDACGITAGAVCKWQRGDAMPTIDNFIILAAIWHTKIDDIIITAVN
ncbi:MAG: helix-turn-helix domain-containing protein [Clostridiales bacterium]|nr:helix-turn-helix domain-containing protein [Clostridiales bacterium]